MTYGYLPPPSTGIASLEEVALGDDARAGQVVVHDHGGTGPVLHHLVGGLTQRVRGADHRVEVAHGVFDLLHVRIVSIA